jgi:hypothetical protein
MYDPTDINYKNSKEIRQHIKAIDPQFVSLAQWVNDKYSVTVLNLYLDYLNVGNIKTPRLTFVLENTKDYNQFFSNPLIHNTQITNTILYYSQEYLYGHNVSNIEKLFIVFNDFQKDYSIELSNKITKNDLWSLIPENNRTSTWEITNINSNITLFFLTEKQKNEYASDVVSTEIKKRYLNIIKKFDTYNYIDPNNILVFFDSKECFDTVYNSNWYYYYK